MLRAGADVCLGFASTEGPTSLTTMARVAGVATYEWQVNSTHSPSDGCDRAS